MEKNCLVAIIYHAAKTDAELISNVVVLVKVNFKEDVSLNIQISRNKFCYLVIFMHFIYLFIMLSFLIQLSLCVSHLVSFGQARSTGYHVLDTNLALPSPLPLLSHPHPLLPALQCACKHALLHVIQAAAKLQWPYHLPHRFKLANHHVHQPAARHHHPHQFKLVNHHVHPPVVQNHHLLPLHLRLRLLPLPHRLWFVLLRVPLQRALRTALQFAASEEIRWTFKNSIN